MYYVYIIKSKKTKRLYTGYTSNLQERFAQHQKGNSPFTRLQRPWKLVYYEAYASKQDAYHREQSLKLRGNASAQLRRRISRSIDES